MPHMKLTFHTDPGHGWLFVSHLQLQTLGLTTKSFTAYSFTDQYGVYAEEDLDAGTVLRAHSDTFGCEPEIDYVDHPVDAPCRGFARCTGDVDEIMARVA